MDFELKYLKYKNKYLKLKNQIGGNLFEILFSDIIKYCIEYNETAIEMKEMIGYNYFVHIKGGASIKYHLMKRELPIHQGITSDIDMYFVSKADKVDDDVRVFLLGLQTKFSDYAWSPSINNGLITISVNGVNIIDITIYTDTYIESDPENSMFSYALNKMGFENHHSYFNMLNQSELVEQKTFTSLEFEKFATMKGIQIQQYYLDDVPNWGIMADIFLKESQNPLYTVEQKYEKHKLYEKYMNQLSHEYLQKIHNKKFRYEQKLEIINKILESK
jgi:hypothetical protein